LKILLDTHVMLWWFSNESHHNTLPMTRVYMHQTQMS
jgi:PIN domain nuclease of toxin-antitoxin system